MNGSVFPGSEGLHPVYSYSLSPLQEGMLFHQMLEPNSGVDVEQVVFTIEAALDAERLRAAWQIASDRNDALRTSFRWDDERPLQDVWADVPVAFVVEDCEQRPAADLRAHVATITREEREKGLPLSRVPLQRVRLLRFSDTAWTLIWTSHHAILDGRGRAILLRDICDAYSGRPLGLLRAQYRAHIDWLEHRDVAATEAFWRDYLRGIVAPTPLPAAFGADPAASSPRITIASHTLDAATTAPLLAFARTAGVTMNVLLQAAWALVLSRHAAVPDVVFGAVRACRQSGPSANADIVGLMINTLPLRIRVDEGASLVTWLQHVRAQWQALREVEHVPLRAVARWSSFEAPAPLFESLFVYERESLAERLRTIDPEHHLGVRDVQMFDQPNTPLSFVASGTDELGLRLQGDTRRFGADDVARLLGEVVEILRGLPALADARVADVSLLSPEESRRIVSGFNRTSSFPREATIHGLFAEQAARAPDAIAAQLGEATMTYGELAARAEAIAAHLQQLGVGPGSYVGLCVERSFDMLAALLGILTAGAASIALDPAHPPERIAHMLGDGRVTVVLAQSHVVSLLDAALAHPVASSARVFAIEALAASPAPGRRMHVDVKPSDGAHVMYTSGSTGKPKGAVIPHDAAVRTVRGADYLDFSAGETFFAFVPLTFDVAILELWGPLLNGARLVICPPGLPSLDVLAKTIESQGVTTLWLTTALFEQMVDEQLPRLRGLRALIVGGDVMSPAHWRRAMAALPNTRLVVVYGPTEACVLVTAHTLQTPPQGPVPLGAPIANATVYVLDARLAPVPIGVPGEIYTGGIGVALGYVNRPALTADRFVPDPFDQRPGATMYRTGDLGQWRPDGAIDFLGRVDNQVKIRGMRVELGEIETALTDHPGVRAAVVIAAGTSPSKQLVAYVVARDGVKLQADEVQAFLAVRLPVHMVPPFVVFLPNLPLTPTGKFDRKALPDPAALLAQPAASAHRRLPSSAAEMTVAAHMAAILGREDMALDDDFYMLGGDSLRAMRLVSRLRDSFRVGLSVRDLLAAPTVGGLTAALLALEREPVHHPVSRIEALRTGGRGVPIFFLHGDFAGGGRYCRELAARIDDAHAFYVIAPHGTDDGVMPDSIEVMGRENCAAIAALAPRGEVILGGFCNGGVVAYETARQLEKAGIAVRRVVIVDGFSIDPDRSPLQMIRYRLGTVLRRSGVLPSATPLARPTPAKWHDWHELLVERWRHVLDRYEPPPYEGRVSLLWTDDVPGAERSTARWRRVAPNTTADRLPGGHLTSITRDLAETSRILARYLQGAAELRVR